MINFSVFLRHQLSNGYYVIMKKTNGIDYNHSYNRGAVVENNSPGPETIMNSIGSSFVIEASHPEGIEFAIPIAVHIGIAFFRFVPGVVVRIGPCIGQYRGNEHLHFGKQHTAYATGTR